MKSDITRWNKKYSAHRYTEEIKPDPMLAKHRPILTGKGAGLDIAAGTGNNALYLADLGYETFAVDGSITALQFGKRKAAANNLKVNWFVADLDSYTFPTGFFDVVVVVKYLNRSLIGEIKASLKNGGVLLFKTFNLNFLQINPAFPKHYVLKGGELQNWFGHWNCVETNDETTNVETQSFWVGTKDQ